MFVEGSNDENLPQGEYNFEIMLEEDIERCCLVIDKVVKFSVLKRIQYDPRKLKDQVKSLQKS